MAIYNWGREHLGFALPASESGLDPASWAAALNYFSGGAVSYTDAVYSTGQAGLQAMAANILATGHAQGANVHNGTHAWSIIGFTANVDPATDPNYVVTGVYVAAPFIAWTDPKAGTYYSASTFIDSMWGRYSEPAGQTQWTGGYAAVIGG